VGRSPRHALALSLAIALTLGATTTRANAHEAKDEGVLWAYLLHEECVALDPGFGERSSKAWGRYRQRHLAEIQGFEANATMREAVSKEHLAAQPPAQLADLSAKCQLLAEPDAFDEPHPPDPRLASPEATWNAYLAAMRSGDPDQVLVLMTFEARKKARARLAAMTPADMRRAAASFGRFEESGGNDTWRFAAATPNDGPRVDIRFKQDDGEWRIDDL